MGVGKMNRFDLEDKITAAWQTENDIDLIYRRLCDAPSPMTEDDIANAMLGLRSIFNMRMDELWEVFTKMIEEGKV